MGTNIERHACFYCGTSNIVLPVPNKSHFPPAYRDKSRLSYYSSLFNSVEINSSFYKIPQRRTVEKWAAEVPDQFVFTFKLWRGITHARELFYEPASIDKFMTSVNGIGSKKGCLLIQLPASIKISQFHKVKNLLDRLSSAKEIDGWKLATEFRDKSWYNDSVYEMLEMHNACAVIHDMPASATPRIDVTSTFSYFRFHGEKGDYKGSYDNDFLKESASRIADELNAGRSVFAYFNNTIGDAVHNAATLNQYVHNHAIVK